MSLFSATCYLARPVRMCIREQLQCVALFHTSLTLEKGGARPKKIAVYNKNKKPKGSAKTVPRQTSRTRLAKDLRPTGESAKYGRLTVAPKGPRQSHMTKPPSRLAGGPIREPVTPTVPRRPRKGMIMSSHVAKARIQDPDPELVDTKAKDSKGSGEPHHTVGRPQTNLIPSSSSSPSSFTRDSVPHEGLTQNHLEPKKKPTDQSRLIRDEPRHVSREEQLGWNRREERRRFQSRTSARPGREEAAVDEEFDRSTNVESSDQLPSKFSSPPLLEGLLTSVKDVLGDNAKPTPIQALSLKHLFDFGPSRQKTTTSTATPLASGPTAWKQWLLASETGSGKSIAYMLPMLQFLKQTESQRRQPRTSAPAALISPRALVLAPTHELARQLASFAKALLHHAKLRVLCASRANTPSAPRGVRGGTASKMAGEVAALDADDGDGAVEIEVLPHGRARPVDVLVGTPMKTLEMVRGRGWDREEEMNAVENQWYVDEHGNNAKRDKWVVGPPEMGLAEVEYVVVDEADVLFDPDFQESTRVLLADISAARGYRVPSPLPNDPATAHSEASFDYPFHLVLTSATIPASLAAYLDTHHPHLTRLASPHLHRLPRTLRTEHVDWTGGNRDADILKRIRRVWAEDALRGPDQRGRVPRSKVLVFCNKSSRVVALGAYLTEQGIANVALTSTGDARRHGSNHHLDPFLKATENKNLPSVVVQPGGKRVEKQEPHVLITTSLLSRGLDFAPSVKHVFMVDPPRNMIDFLHRAGRSGRAGEPGKVVMFGKLKGRGSDVAKQVRRRVGALTH